MVREHRPRKRFGQHFLTDTAVLDRIGAALAPSPSDSVLEIGPGTGALTAVLYPEVDRMRAIELDRDLVRDLSERFPGLDIVSGDILDADLEHLFAGDAAWRVVGNLPYNITSPLLLRLVGCERIRDMLFMVQREVAERLTAEPGTKQWGRLSVAVQYHCRVDALFDVDPSAFTPPPKVVSSVVRLEPRACAVTARSVESLQRVVRAAFGQRRKRLANALKSLEFRGTAVARLGDKRADQVTVEEYVLLANELTGERE